MHNATTVRYSQYHGAVLSIPRCGTLNTTVRYSQYHGVVLLIPRRGTLNTTVWYSQYHGVVLAVPSRDDFLVLSARMRKIMLNYRRAKNSVFIFYLFLYKISCISAKIQASLIFCVRFALSLQPKIAT